MTAKLQGMTVFTIGNFKTQSAEEFTAKFLSRDRMEHIGHFPTSMEMCLDDHLTLTIEKTQQKQFQGKTSEQSCSTHSISSHSQKNTVHSHVEFPPDMQKYAILPREPDPAGKRENYTHRYRYIYIRNDQLSEQILYTQHTHISGEFPPTEYGDFQQEGISIPQHQ